MRKGLIIGIVIAVVFILVIGGIYMVSKNSSSTTLEGEANDNLTQESSPTQLERELMKISEANENLDPSLCAEIEGNASRHNCYMTVAYYLRDPNICENIPRGYYKLFCETWNEEGVYTVNTTRTVWANTIVNFTHPFDTVDFNYRFSSDDAEGYAIVFLDEKLLGAFNESEKETGKSYFSDTLMLDPSLFTLGEHLLSVFVVPLSEKKSEFSIEDFTLYQSGNP